MARVVPAALLLYLFVALPVLADDFSDFRIPKHRVYSVTGDASFRYSDSGNRSSQSSQGSANTNGSLDGLGYWLWDSDPLRLSVSGTVDLEGSAVNGGSDRYSDDYNLETYSRDRRVSRSLGESWSVSGSSRIYPLPMPIGLTFNGQAHGGYGQWWDWDSDDSHGLDDYGMPWQRADHDDSYGRNYHYDVSGTVGFGYGRVRDASVVYDVAILQDRLLQTGAMHRRLSDSARRRLASLIYFADEYAEIHDHSAKFFWREVETILRDDSALVGTGLNAYSLQRIAEPYFQSPSTVIHVVDGATAQNYLYRPSGGFLRQRGWFVGINAQGSHYHRIDRSFYHTHSFRSDSGIVSQDTTLGHRSSYNHAEDAIFYGPSLEYHFPLTMRWQLDGDLSGLYHFDKYERQSNFSIQAGINVEYLIADRWRFSAALSEDWHRTHRNNPDVWYSTLTSTDWETNLAASLDYYFEDRLSASLAYHFSDAGIFSGQDEIFPDHPVSRSHSSSVSLGFSYHFLGVLDAPGIVPRSSIPPMQWPFR
jgi:hypothetical protein